MGMPRGTRKIQIFLLLGAGLVGLSPVALAARSELAREYIERIKKMCEDEALRCPVGSADPGCDPEQRKCDLDPLAGKSELLFSCTSFVGEALPGVGLVSTHISRESDPSGAHPGAQSFVVFVERSLGGPGSVSQPEKRSGKLVSLQKLAPLSPVQGQGSLEAFKIVLRASDGAVSAEDTYELKVANNRGRIPYSLKREGVDEEICSGGFVDYDALMAKAKQ